MTPKEKAKELVDNFLEKIPFADTYIYKDWRKEMYDKAKQCALIAVDEILNQFYGMLDLEYDIEYWEEVKQEIEKL